MYLPNLSIGRVAGTCALTLLAIASFDQAPANADFPANGSLTVQINGLENTDGQVCFNLYDSSTGFPNSPEAVIAKQCVAALQSPAEQTTVAPDDMASTESSPLSVTFPDLSIGTYAVSVLHDENGDEQINQGTFGIPTEGFGFSRNPVIQAGAPDFYETALFVFGSTTTEIEMVYF